MHHDKFAGEPRYVPYFWDMHLRDQHTSDDGFTLTFDVTTVDQVKFPELGNTITVYLVEDKDGNIRSRTEEAE